MPPSSMPGSKRSLTPRFDPGHGKSHPAILPPLREGFAIPPKASRSPVPAGQVKRGPCGVNPLPYGRGSASEALAHMGDPALCRSALWEDVSAATTKGPNASRIKLWADLARKGGFHDPFLLEPDMIFKVMGALKLAGFRSAQLYMDTAKAQHIAAGHSWTAQLQQCYRAAVRSCNRHIGNPKQAAPLPLAKLAQFQVVEPVARGGPKWPGRSTILAAWWLLREIEASHAQRQHVDIDAAGLKVNWRLPSSKTDWKALGAVRSHTCSCEFTSMEWCPYHCMISQLKDIGTDPEAPLFPDGEGRPPTKSGWADTFQWLGEQLGLDINHPNGARRFTGHTARATGAVHLASTQIELWRVQLFGRWGSEVFLHYIRDAPVCQLDKLALETSVHLSLNTARAQLQDLLRRNTNEPNLRIACPSQDMLQDCEAAAGEIVPPKLSDPAILNKNSNKTHRALVYGDDFHPKEWKTRCAWHFGQRHTDYEVVPLPENDQRCCLKCFPEFRDQKPNNSKSDSESSDSSSSSS